MIGLEHVKANGRRILSEDDYRSLEGIIGATGTFLQNLLNMLNDRVQELEENGGGVEGDFDGDGLPDVTMDRINQLITNATNLLNSATAVSELAIAAKDEATGSAFNASVSETKTAEYLDDAENAAVRASKSSTVAASIATGGDLLGNPILEKWGEEAEYPDAWGTTVVKPEYFSKLEGESRYGSQVLRANVLTATTCTIATASLTDKYYFSNYYVLEAEVELIEGEIDGAAVIVEHNNNVSFRSILPFGTHAVKSGDFYKIRRVIAVPFVADEASFTHFKVIYAPNIIDGGELTIKDIYLHKLAIRPASTEEIRTFNVQSEIYASITEEMEVLVSETGQVGAKYGVKVDLNGYVTGYGLLATNNDGVPTSEMIFSVDSFKIVKPTGPGSTVTPLTMFSVGTHNGVPSLVINGVVYGDGSIGGPAIAPRVIDAQHITTEEFITVSAQIKNAIIEDAHMGNVTIGSIKLDATTYASSWQMGGDATKINGGALSANTVEANALVIGLRGLTVENLKFEFNSPGANQVSWTTGTIRYLGNDGNVAVRTITANNFLWTSGTLFLCWVMGATTLTVTTDTAVAHQQDRVILATYSGGSILDATYGRTVINGGDIKTGTVTATKMSVTSLSSISADFGDIRAGKASSMDDKMVLDFNNKFFRITQ